MGDRNRYPWTDDEFATARTMVASGHSYRAIGAALGRSYSSVKSKFRDASKRPARAHHNVPLADFVARIGIDMNAPTVPAPPPVPEAHEAERLQDARRYDALKRQLSDERKRRWQAEDEAERASRASGMLDALHANTPKLPPIVPHASSKARNCASPVLLCSDWHVEETVDPRTLNGRNEYSPAIAEQRAAFLFEGFAWFVEQWGKAWDIHRAVVWCGGDIISGYIHPELVESNAMSPTEATLFAQGLIERGLRYLLERCPGLEIDVPCSYGNHGRSTEKRRVSTAATNSFEWLMYHSLAARMSDEQRVRFAISNGSHLYSDVMGERIRWTHGDDVRYAGGVGGLSIPLRKACDAWDDFERVDLTAIGHYHSLADYGFAVVNGSLMGYNPFALSVKARYEPPRQLAFLIDEEWGRRLVTPIYCDPTQRAGRRAA